MGDKSPIVASDEQRVALAALAGSRDRGEADRARAVLLTLSGWTSPRIKRTNASLTSLQAKSRTAGAIKEIAVDPPLAIKMLEMGDARRFGTPEPNATPLGVYPACPYELDNGRAGVHGRQYPNGR